MRKKKHVRNKDFSSNYNRRMMYIVLGVLLFISIILVIVMIQPLLTSSESLIDIKQIDDGTANQTTDAIKEAPNITIFGSQVFKDKMKAAFDLLAICAPEDLATADEFLTGIYESNGSYAGAQIYANSTNIQISSNLTGYLPDNYSSSGHTFWYAGAIVHEARHSWQFLQLGLVKDWMSRTPEENNAVEIDALNVQITTFKKCVDDIPLQQRHEAETILEKFEGMRDKKQKLKFESE